MAEIKDKASYCEDIIKRVDYDRYLTVLYAPEEVREDLFALYAFNYEISKIRETVSEPMLGEIRLQWWRESVEGIFSGNPRNHEVVLALVKVIENRGLLEDDLLSMIEGRKQDIYDENPDNLTALDDYLAETAGKLTSLAVRCLGQDDIDDLAMDMGKAWGYVGLIRAIPYHLSLKKNYIPSDLMKKHGLENDKFLPPDNPKQMKPIIQELCQLSEKKLDKVKQGKVRITSKSRSVFLLSALTRSYLKTIKKADYNPFQLEEKADSFFRQWRLLRSALFNRI